MIKNIEEEFSEFRLYHKNIYNISFHIFCGFIFMSFFLLLFNKNKNLVLLLYSFLILFTINNIFISGIIFICLFLLINTIFKNYKSTKTILFLFLAFYFLPEVSHYLTNEKTVLKINNITFFKIFNNIFYLLPFSILCLFNSK
jgi:hypothetical protein